MSTPSPVTATPLVPTSIQVLREGQHASGGYVACPTYPTYRYAWLRDGAFCAYAMDLHAHTDSAAAFHDFVARTLRAHRDRILAATRAPTTDSRRMPPTRYTLTGQLERPADAGEQWPNFQLDGYGTWLWVLRDHLSRHQGRHQGLGHPPTPGVLDAATLAADYLKAAGHLACYDCWEEFPDQRHTSTLAAVVAGLSAAADLLDRPDLAARAADLRADLAARHMRAGGFVKHDATDAVDASLLWLALPFGLVDPTDPAMRVTADRIATELTGPGGGVRRYLGDEFYGGGDWVLLTAWLGWYHAAVGDRAAAAACRAWVERAATPAGWLPEQVSTAVQDPTRVEPWVRRWGPVATPLLWSHAMYLVLDHALGAAAR